MKISYKIKNYEIKFLTSNVMNIQTFLIRQKEILKFTFLNVQAHVVWKVI